jgi:FixJ family two-component response regulator
MIAAIERALARGELVRAQRTELNSFRAQIASLTPRERQVFYLMLRGMINKKIAGELGTTERTVKAHRHAVMEKMQVESLAELVSNAVRLGVIVPDAGN